MPMVSISVCDADSNGSINMIELAGCTGIDAQEYALAVLDLFQQFDLNEDWEITEDEINDIPAVTDMPDYANYSDGIEAVYNWLMDANGEVTWRSVKAAWLSQWREELLSTI